MIVVSTVLALAEGKGGLLEPDGSLLIIFAIFIALVYTLNRVLFRPIMHVLAERERRTWGSDTDVRAILNSIDQNLAGYEESIRDTRTEGYRVLEARRADAVASRQTAIEAARASAASRIESARAEIEGDATIARGRLETDAREIASTITASVLGRAAGGGR